MKKRHAYLILAHKNPGQLRRLLSLLDDSRNDIYVHVDGRASFGPEALVGACRRSGLFFPARRYRVHWGGVSIMRSELALLEAAVSGGDYSYCHLLSGMDMPLTDQDTIHAFFDAHHGREFINLWPMKADTADRFHYYTLFPEGARNFLTHFLNDSFKSFQKLVGYSMNKDVEFRSASQWFSITGELARYVVSRRDWLEKVFQHTCLCDEIFLATLVWNSPFRDRVCTEDMRLIDWSSGGEGARHPWTFRLGDLDRIMSSGKFWARKFDEGVDSRIIDEVCARLVGSGQRRLFLMAAYNPQGKVGPSLEAYVRELSGYGDVAVCMDNTAESRELEKLSPSVIHAEAARHGEYDFGSYKRAFAWAKENLTLSDYDVLYLVNDSVYGPLMPLGGYLERMEDLGAGAFAMVYNPHRRTPHLQSWFIGLDRSVFLSEWFSLFLEGVRPLAGKEDVCMVYECGLTGLLSAHGVRCDALFRMAGKAVYNHVKSAWQAGMPFVKKSAFTRHGGSLGREIRHVLEHAEECHVARAIRKDAEDSFGEDYVGWLLGGTAVDMVLRYISYLSGKIIRRRK
mgnify:CR=1 FL=1